MQVQLKLEASAIAVTVRKIRRHLQKVIGIVGQPIEIAQRGRLVYSRDRKPGGAVELKHRVHPAADVVRHVLERRAAASIGR